MISRIGLLTRKPGMSAEAFDQHWRNTHGPLAAQFPGMRAYYQNLVVDNEQFGVSKPRGQWDLAGFSELQFDDLESMRAAITSTQAQGARDDLSAFLDGVDIVACEKHVVVPVETGDSPYIKRMTLLKRLPGTSPDHFRHEWLNVHADLVRQWPNVLGYVQNIVVERYSGAPDQTVDYETVPVDGIVEFWFRDKDQAAEIYASDAVARTQRHADDFLAEITPFFVEPRRIV